MNNIYRLLSTFVVLVLLLGACTDDFEETNTDPNQPIVVPAENLFTQAQFALADRMWGRAMNFEFAMLMVQHFSQNEYAEDSRYNQNPSTFNVSWQSFYASGLNDLAEAKTLTENNETISEAVRNNRLAQIAILRVWAFQMVTDIWGDVPYSQALQPEEFPNPVYDSQQSIYSGLISEINGAIARITPDEAGFGNGDIIYGGDMALWGRFANSVKLRIGMRMADVASSEASTIVSEALSSSLGVISSNAQNAEFVFNSDQRIANPFYVDAITRDDFAISAELAIAMADKDDPRLAEYAMPNPNGEIVGLPYGLTDAASFQLKPMTSRPHDQIKEATAPAILMSYAEVEFFRAEAIERNFVSGSAESAFNNAVTASFNQWGLSDALAGQYLADNSYDAANWEESIGYEKWVALYTQGIEAWAEQRRLDEPELELPADAVTSFIPVRAFYPAVEAEANAENLSAIGFNNMEENVWWDVQ
ncbi:SusD/RagB family nutrient-binding outer membrane lipoprotein [Fulvivirga kasyanovii]|uniref:SusD/RagB family nutrient-binding outer membrane lipoprotein n=1 Tax=Fulvivirga kasyanovii TaxID=396812 RepID=A0ABW9RUM4_9BACT|nr:SusD/RagB family nutrient-binding outer membrane lipoprotein [Fulvivirga kasyanovii]MTI27924.1 SusD/RagB family nutrient-binding outer membrane lipoprotein [Fulvivirga kasyanovii]